VARQTGAVDSENNSDTEDFLARAHGRGHDELRPVTLTPDFITIAEGSVLIEAGNTRIITTVSVDDGVPGFLKGSGKGWITSEYGMLPRATETRTPRESTRGKQSGRTLEISRLIGRSLRAMTDLKALGERTVWVDCDVIQADGGTRTAAITGAFVALALAFEHLVGQGILRNMPLRDSLAAVSVGIVEDELLLDLDYDEDSRAQVDMNVVMTGSGRFVEVQASAEGREFTGDEFTELLELASGGIEQLTQIQQSLLRMTFRGNPR
jgi:ribonuclease PH